MKNLENTNEENKIPEPLIMEQSHFLLEGNQHLMLECFLQILDRRVQEEEYRQKHACSEQEFLNRSYGF